MNIPHVWSVVTFLFLAKKQVEGGALLHQTANFSFRQRFFSMIWFHVFFSYPIFFTHIVLRLRVFQVWIGFFAGRYYTFHTFCYFFVVGNPTTWSQKLNFEWRPVAVVVLKPTKYQDPWVLYMLNFFWGWFFENWQKPPAFSFQFHCARLDFQPHSWKSNHLHGEMGGIPTINHVYLNV